MSEDDREDIVFSDKKFSFKVFLWKGFDNPAKKCWLKSIFLLLIIAKM